MLNQVNFLGSLGGSYEDVAEVLEMMAAGRSMRRSIVKRFDRGDASLASCAAVRD